MCGIIGVCGNEEAVHLATLGLFAEQHRGQESCGLAVSNGAYIKLHKKMGLVKDVFTPEVLSEMNGKLAIGHVRYPTCGASSEYNSQPHLVETLFGPVYSLASNGDITNYKAIRKQLEDEGVFFHSYNDGELLIRYLVYNVSRLGKTIPAAIRDLMKELKGAYSTVFMTRNEMYIFRDPHGIRPLSIAKLSRGGFVAASESCALDLLGVEWKREVKCGEIIRLSNDKMEVYENDLKQYRQCSNAHHCIFEHIYFSRPDSYEFGTNVYEVRRKIGAELAAYDDITPDVVVPVPDSSNFIALGYAEAKKVPFELGLIRNHYVGRTFIKPDQTIRDESVYQKFNPLPNFFENKEVVLVDDSIVRGTTLPKIVNLIRWKGARKIHLRIGSPPVRYSCYYGIDTPSQEKLLAHRKSYEEIVSQLGVDSLMYMSMDMLCRVVDDPENYCKACFDGKYPVYLDKEITAKIEHRNWDFSYKRL